MSENGIYKVRAFFFGMIVMFCPCFVLMHYTNYLGRHAVYVEACEIGLGEFVARDGSLTFQWKEK
jgi:hypothetical protein